MSAIPFMLNDRSTQWSLSASLQSLMADELNDCPLNCSGNGMCNNGKCLCLVQFSGGSCSEANRGYFIAFGTIFSTLALISLIQLCICIWSEYVKKQKNSMWSACKITTQKMLYLLTVCASTIRGTYFFAKMNLSEQVACNLWSAYYPFLLTGFSLIVCFWAEAFHINNIPAEQRHFLSKSFVAFIIFNIFIYLVLGAQFIAMDVIVDDQQSEFVNKIFNGLFAVLMFIVVVFFLIYGVEVYFKVRGAFTQADCNLDLHQLHMSRLGLVAQASLQLFTALFLISDVLKEVWKDKLPVLSQNFYDIGFQIVEFGVTLWFPCVLWNCCSPEKLWVLNPKQILKTFDLNEDDIQDVATQKHYVCYESMEQIYGSHVNCWICYDIERVDAGSLIQPCQCKGDTSIVHHECLRKWLVECDEKYLEQQITGCVKNSKLDTQSSSRTGVPKCRICLHEYALQESHHWIPKGVKAQQWMQVSSTLVLMTGVPFVAYTVCHYLSRPYIQVLAIGLTAILELICLKILSINAIAMYKRGRLSSINILGKTVAIAESTTKSSCHNHAGNSDRNCAIAQVGFSENTHEPSSLLAIGIPEQM